MIQILSGAGWFLAVASPLAALAVVMQGTPLLALSAFFSFCTGVSFIIVRRLVDELDESNTSLEYVRRDIKGLKQEVERIKAQITP